MDPIFGGALIKAGGGLLGSLFGKKPPGPRAQIMSHMKGVREGAEKYGFNPLAWAGTTGTSGVAEPNYIGSAIADATAAVADAWSDTASRKAEADLLAQENEELRKKVMNDTIRPKMPGLFEMPQSVQAPSMGPDGRPRTSTGAGGKGPAGMTDAPADYGRVDGKNPANFFDLVTDAADPTFTESASDVAKAVPVVPYLWGGQWFTPHPGYPDASFVEEYFGDEGPGATTMNWQQGIDKVYHHLSQTPWGMRIEGWKRGDYERISEAKKMDERRKEAEASNGGVVPKDWWKHQFPVMQ